VRDRRKGVLEGGPKLIANGFGQLGEIRRPHVGATKTFHRDDGGTRDAELCLGPAAMGTQESQNLIGAVRGHRVVSSENCARWNLSVFQVFAQ
jgi:hypothetical protein